MVLISDGSWQGVKRGIVPSIDKGKCSVDLRDLRRFYLKFHLIRVRAINHINGQ